VVNIPIESIQGLPKHAKEIFESVMEELKGKKNPRTNKPYTDEERAQIAWAAVKEKYKKGKNGEWVKKSISMLQKDIPKFAYNMTMKSVDTENRVIVGSASVEEIDRHSDLITMSAFENAIQGWLENPVIRWKHGEPIGKGLNAWVEGNTFKIKAKISDKTTLANEVWGLIEDGIIKSFSVGGRVLKQEPVKSKDDDKIEYTKVTKIDLYEVSVCDIPANKHSFFDIIGKCVNCDVKNDAYIDEMLGSMKNMRGEGKNKNIEENRMAEEENNEDAEQEDNEETENAEKTKNTEKPTKQKTEKIKTTKKDEDAEDNEDLEESAKIKSLEKQVRILSKTLEKAIKSKPFRKAMQEEAPQDFNADVGNTYGIQAFADSRQSGALEKVFPFNKDIQQNNISKVYYGGILSKVDMREGGMKFSEALETFYKYTYTQTGGIGTAGFAMVPVYVDPEIVDRTKRELTFLAALPRRAVRGMTYDYNAITALTNATFLAEDAELADLTDTYDRFSISMKYGYSTGRASYPMIDASRNYIDIMSEEVMKRTIGLKREEDNLCFSGDSSTTATDFDGLVSLITTNASDQGGALTIPAMRTEITQCRDSGGVINLIVTTNSVSDDLKGLLNAYQRYVNSIELNWGITTMTFDGIPVITDRYCQSGYMYFLDMSVIFMAVLRDFTYMELPSGNDTVKFTIKAYEALVCQAEGFCSILYGIT